MNHRLSLSCIALLLLVTLVATPVLAATLSSTVSCPSSCSCLSPAEAAKINTPGLCNGKQTNCGSEGKTEKYCYSRPVTVTPTTALPQLIATGFHPIPTTVPAFVKCSPDCSCEYEPDGMRRQLTLCGGSQYLCGMDHNGVRMYCYVRPPPTPLNIVPAVTGVTLDSNVLPAVPPTTFPKPAVSQTVTSTATTPAPTGTGPCAPGCRCLAPDKADPSGYKRCNSSAPACSYDPLGRAMYCYTVPFVTMVSPVPADGTLPNITSRPPSDVPVPDIQRKTTTPVPSDNAPPSFFSSVGTFFASFFGTQSGSSPSQSSSLQPVPCNGIMTSVMTDPDNCGSCGVQCSSGSCVAGQCTDTSRQATACGPGAVQCDGTCTYTRSDESNCGSCGQMCPTGDHCCAGSCTGLLTPANCGICGNTCSTGQACCSGKCTDTTSDRLHCGSCGRPCPGTSVCERSVCVDRTCEEALFLERKENADLRARLDLLSERYAELETRFNYCLWLEDYYKGGYNHCCGDHCLYPPEPTDDVPMVTDSGE